MTQQDGSYVETSGSALILYGIGAGLAGGYLGPEFREPFETGIQSLTAYITPELDIFHTCTGCLAPGTGSVLDFMARPTRRNDAHAFGPVALAMGQAHLLGIQELRKM
jgi:unsaturated rhamnogalacturonyl hydrolase